MRANQTFTTVPKVIYMIVYENKKIGSAEEILIYTIKGRFERALGYIKRHGELNILSITKFTPKKMTDMDVAHL